MEYLFMVLYVVIGFFFAIFIKTDFPLLTGVCWPGVITAKFFDFIDDSLKRMNVRRTD